MKKLCCLLICLSLCVVVFGQEKYKEAKELMEQKKFKKALEAVDKDIAERGFIEDNAVLKTRIAMYVNGDLSFETAQKAVKSFPNSAKVYHARAILFFEMRDLESSVLDDTKALELCKDDSLKFEIYMSRSGCLHYQNKIDNSIKDCRDALAIRPNDIKGLNNLSTVLFAKGESVESMEILEKIKKIDPKFIGSYVNLGYQNQQLGRFAEAEKHLLQGLQIEPQNSFILNNLGFVQHKSGKTAEGIKNINKSIKVDPSNSYCYRNLAFIYLDKNEKDKACENIKKSLELGFTTLYGAEMKDLSQKHCLR